MSITIGSNLLALRVSRRLEIATNQVGGSFQRLSSGSRINRGSDDAAGLAISSSLNARSRIYGQSIRDINDAVSRVNVASSTVSGLTEIVNRLAELSAQASNSTLSGKQRFVINTEARALVAEYNRSVQSTQYQGITVIDGSNDNLSLRAGVGETADTQVQIGQEMGTAAGDGTFTAGTAFGSFDVGVATGDINNDGKMDIVGDQYFGMTTAYLGNGNGTFTQTQSWAFNDGDMRLADFNNDGKLDVAGVVAYQGVQVALGNGDGTFGASTSLTTGTPGGGAWAMTIADLNNDGNVDVVASNHDGTIGVRLGTGSGTFNSLISIASGGGGTGISSGDLNNDGNADIFTISGYLLGRGDGTFGSLNTSAKGAIAVDLNSDGNLDLVGANQYTNQVVTYLGNGNGTFQSGVNAATHSSTFNSLWAYSGDFTGDGNPELVLDSRGSLDVYKSNGDGTLTNMTTLVVGDPGTNAAIADFNGDGTQDVITGASGSRVRLGNADSSGRRKNVIDQVDLTSVASARSALDWCRNQIQRLSRELGNLGAYQSRLESQLSNLHGGRLGSAEAASRIADVDIAQEMSTEINAGILQKSSVSLLAQANLQPEIALQVLKQETFKR